MAISFSEALAKDDLPRREVHVPQWGGSVWIRSLRADERSQLEGLFAGRDITKDPGSFRRELLLRTLINEDGTPWATAEEIPQIMQKSAAAVEVLFEASAELNAFRKQDIDEIEGNSNGTPGGRLHSASALP